MPFYADEDNVQITERKNHPGPAVFPFNYGGETKTAIHAQALDIGVDLAGDWENGKTEDGKHKIDGGFVSLVLMNGDDALYVGLTADHAEEIAEQIKMSARDLRRRLAEGVVDPSQYTDYTKQAEESFENLLGKLVGDDDDKE